QLYYLDRTTYRRRTEPDFLVELQHTYGPAYLLPEGGTNALALRGMSELIGELRQHTDFDTVAVAAGTGGTLAGLALGLAEAAYPARALGIAALKGVFLWRKIGSTLTDLNPLAAREPQVTVTHNTVLTQVEALGRLELVRYRFKDVVEYKKSSKYPFLPDAKAALIVGGEAVGCLDLRKIKPQDVTFEGDSVRENNGVTSRRVVEALRYEAIFAFHAGREEGHVLVLARTFLNAGDGDSVAAIGQEAFFFALFNGNFHSLRKLLLADDDFAGFVFVEAVAFELVGHLFLGTLLVGTVGRYLGQRLGGRVAFGSFVGVLKHREGKVPLRSTGTKRGRGRCKERAAGYQTL
nr:hypothetical protein [Tanacetum cinerariifolium]